MYVCVRYTYITMNESMDVNIIFNSSDANSSGLETNISNGGNSCDGNKDY